MNIVHVHRIHEWERLRGLGGEEKNVTEKKFADGTGGRGSEVLYEVLAHLKRDFSEELNMKNLRECGKGSTTLVRPTCLGMVFSERFL